MILDQVDWEPSGSNSDMVELECLHRELSSTGTAA